MKRYCLGKISQSVYQTGNLGNLRKKSETRKVGKQSGNFVIIGCESGNPGNQKILGLSKKYFRKTQKW